MICIGDFDLGVGIVVGIGIGILFKMIWDYFFNRVRIMTTSRKRLQEILEFSRNHPKSYFKKGFLHSPTNLYKIGFDEDYLEILD